MNSGSKKCVQMCVVALIGVGLLAACAAAPSQAPSGQPPSHWARSLDPAANAKAVPVAANLTITREVQSGLQRYQDAGNGISFMLPPGWSKKTAAPEGPLKAVFDKKIEAGIAQMQVYCLPSSIATHGALRAFIIYKRSPSADGPAQPSDNRYVLESDGGPVEALMFRGTSTETLRLTAGDKTQEIPVTWRDMVYVATKPAGVAKRCNYAVMMVESSMGDNWTGYLLGDFFTVARSLR